MFCMLLRAWSRLSFKPSPAACVVLSLAALVSVACGRGGSSRAVPSATSAKAKSSRRNASGDALVAEGARSFERYCQLCHAKDATGYAADNAPSLVTKTFLESAPDELIAAGIRMGRPGTAMAAYGKSRGGPLDEREIVALVHFLRSKGPQSHALPPASANGDAKRGGEVFEKNCQTCHGTVAMRGNALSLQNPELLAAASPAFLRYAVANGRAPTPMPAFQGKLSDLEIDDVVAWLWSFKPALPTAPVQELEVPKDLPVVINPKGARPKFTLREDRFVPAEQVKKALDAKQRIVIIDARAASDWIQFHIPGAISAPYHDRAELDRVPKDGTWVVAYCACPHHASGEVVDALRERKYPNTAVLDEGILFWKDHGYGVVGEAIKPGEGNKPAPNLPPAVVNPGAPAKSAVPAKSAATPAKSAAPVSSIR
jgi:mono/diheme cytochrome c family protein/rhodanese-related sulfurtransferase